MGEQSYEILGVHLTNGVLLKHEADTLVYQQGQGNFCQREEKHLICKTARLPICAKVTWHLKIKANENGLFEY